METIEEKRATFTPGPWYAWFCEENETGGGIFQDTNTESQRMICRMAKEKRVIHKDKRKSDDFVHSAEDEANARLIAAAPELLEQCKLFEKVLTHLINSGDSGADLERDKLREVLAKVEGGEA
jgi:hypothetical protein